ncbi:MAG: carbohydrate kinase family protein, partial [Gemmatimonadales bacterium]
EALRHGFKGPIYADLHSLFLGMGGDGVRVLRPLPNAPTWFSFFDIVQLNEEEMQQLAADPLVVAAEAIAAGVSLLNVTVGPRGVVYVARAGFGDLRDRVEIAGADAQQSALASAAITTQRLAPPHVDATDPTGCGDVFGATCFARLLAGDTVEAALQVANSAAARNATFRGAGGLPRHLRGELVLA